MTENEYTFKVETELFSNVLGSNSYLEEEPFEVSLGWTLDKERILRKTFSPVLDG